MKTDDIMELGRRYLMPTYAQAEIALVRGQGADVWDADGRCYLDFLGGIAVNGLGHCHPRVVEAVIEQTQTLMHCSNLYWMEPAVRLAVLLAENSALDRAFFCNSGTEANEGAIKLARKYGAQNRDRDCFEIITFHRSFHGRTLAALAASGQEKLHAGFEPLPTGFRYVPFNDVKALKEAVNRNTCAVMVEPVQGEGGVYPATAEFMRCLEELRQQTGILLIFDEIQCGLGRTGSLFAYEHYGVEPDIMTLAKSLGGGLPIGVILAKEDTAQVFQPGTHGSTFGGNPVACAAALANLNYLLEENLVEKVTDTGAYLRKKLEEIASKLPIIKEVRGLGLMLGIELSIEGRVVVDECLARGLLLNCTAGKVIRLLPPLIVNREQVDRAVTILDDVLSKLAEEKPAE